MSGKIMVLTMLGLALAGRVAGQESKTVGMSNVERVLTVPEVYRSPSSRSPEIMDVVSQTNLLADLCENWRAGKTPDDRSAVLRFAVDLGAYNVGTKRRTSYSDERVAKALVAALDDESLDVRETAASLLEQRFRIETIRALGPQIVEVVRKRKLIDAILLLGLTGVAEAASLLQEDKAFRRASGRYTELALARLGNEEYQTNFIGQFRTAKSFREKFTLASDLAYIGNDAACKALAEELRNPEIARVDSGMAYALRRNNIIDALRKALPDEPVLEPPDYPGRRDASYYAAIEAWAEKKYSITWTNARPAFRY